MIEVPCIRSNRNTGKSDCPFNPGLEKMGYMAPVGNCKITAANRVDQDTLKTFINAQLQHDNPALRWHMIGPFEDVKDASDAKTIFTFPNGRKVVTDGSHPAHEFQLWEGGKDYHRSVMSFNGQAEYYKYFSVDINNTIQGTEDIDDDTTMTGYTLTDFYTDNYVPATKTTPAGYMGLKSFADAAEMNERYFAIRCTTNLVKLKGVQDVKIVNGPTSAVAGVHNIMLLTGGGTLNLSQVLGAATATQTNFIMRNKATGAIVTKTGALSADGSYITLTASLVDADYVDGANMEITLDSVSTLSTNGLKYFEALAPLVVVAKNP